MSTASSPTNERGTPPVFIPCRNLPEVSNTDNKIFSVREICAAAEKTSGYNTVIGAQRIGNLWRIYPRSVENRASLLLNGIEIRNILISPYDKNPFIVRTPQGETEAPTTKIIIGNLPISYSNEEIEAKLLQLGCQLQSRLLMERDRDEKGGLTRWLTGRRFAYIRIPDRPLPEKVNVGPATATLYHREQKLTAQTAVCSRCLATGHRAASCDNQIVCKTCNQPGHKKGHPSCPLIPPTPDAEKETTASTKIQMTDSTQDQMTDSTEDLMMDTIEDQMSDSTTADQPEKRVNSSSPSLPRKTQDNTSRRGRSKTMQPRLSFNSKSQSSQDKDTTPPQPKQGGKKRTGT